jgi:TetR/AcrR family transcriptional regulator
VTHIRYESFENLEETKKSNIINAGFKVFAKYGYAKASIEEITKEANISKGSLFYYFENKKNFYIYLYEYCGEQLEKLIDSPGPDGKPSYMAHTDFFDRLYEIQLLKMKYSSEYPHMYNFMKKVVFDTDSMIKEAVSSINEKYTKERAMAFFQGLDYYKFKEGIDPMMVIQLLTWCSEGCVNQILLQEMQNPTSQKISPDFGKVITLYQSYVKLFKENFYKEEYLKPKS